MNWLLVHYINPSTSVHVYRIDHYINRMSLTLMRSILCLLYIMFEIHETVMKNLDMQDIRSTRSIQILPLIKTRKWNKTPKYGCAIRLLIQNWLRHMIEIIKVKITRSLTHAWTKFIEPTEKSKGKRRERKWEKKTRILRTLTHCSTRINPKGNLSTWNVPSDIICLKTNEHYQ